MKTPSGGSPPGPDRRDAWRMVRLAGTAASMLLLAWLLSRQDWEVLLAGLRSVPLRSFVLVLGLLAGRHFAFALRWSYLLRAQGIRINYWTVVKLQYASLFASNFLPTTVGGDIARLAGAMSRSQDRLVAGASVLVDRAIGAIGMLFVLPFSWPLAAGYLSASRGTDMLVGMGLVSTIGSWWDRLTSALKLWLAKPGSLLMALLSTWLGILSYMLAIWSLAAVLGMPVGLAEVAGVTGLTYFISLVPFTISAYGLRELSMVAFYTQLGATSEHSAVLALVSRLAMVTVSLPGALALGGVLQPDESVEPSGRS